MGATIIWFVWSILMAWLPRAVVVRLLHKRLGPAAYLAAYATWLLLFTLGMILVEGSGLQFYGFDRSSGWHIAGWLILFLSPLGLPLLVGAPCVIVGDIAAALWRRSSRTSLFAALDEVAGP